MPKLKLVNGNKKPISELYNCQKIIHEIKEVI